MQKENNISISLVIPIYNENQNINLLNDKIFEVIKYNNFTNYEILYINDGSDDDSGSELNKLAEKNERIKVIHLQRNYGQTAALSAGIEEAIGEIIITLDGDLQNDPADIPKLLKELNSGFDVISGWRKKRRDKMFTRIIPSKIANWLISMISGVRLHDYGCTLKAYRASIIKDIGLYGEMHRFIPIFASWQGGKIKELEVKHHPRKFGQTKYGINRTLRVISDLILIKFMDKYSMNPIHLFGGFGILNFFLSIIAFLFMIYFKYWGGKSFVETPLPQLVVLFFLVGILSVFMGFIAEILMRTYYESQNKKIYQIRKIIN